MQWIIREDITRKSLMRLARLHNQQYNTGLEGAIEYLEQFVAIEFYLSRVNGKVKVVGMTFVRW